MNGFCAGQRVFMQTGQAGFDKSLNFSYRYEKRRPLPDTEGMSTAIVYAWTPDGFVIGADGRRSNLEGAHEIQDDVQKIFSVKRDGLRLVYAWSGSVHFKNL
jgi:hypothetical protein